MGRASNADQARTASQASPGKARAHRHGRHHRDRDRDSDRDRLRAGTTLAVTGRSARPAPFQPGGAP